MNLRRWQERLAQAAEGQVFWGLGTVFRGGRNAISGTALAAPFPGTALLLAAGYACVEDLPDPDLDDIDDARAELERVADLDPDTLDLILAARGFDLTES